VGYDRHPRVGDRRNRRRPHPVLDARTFPEYRSRPELRQPLSALLDPQHAVEDQKDVGPRFAFLHQCVSGRHPTEFGFASLPHHLGRQCALEGGLHRSDQCGGVLVAPRRVLPEGFAVPVAKVGQPRLGRQVVVGAVDPVPGEFARPEDFEFGGTVAVQREAQRRPHQGCLPLDVRAAPDPPRGGEAGPTSRRLDESDRTLAHVRRLLEDGERHRLELVMEPGHSHRRRSHEAAPEVTAPGHPAVLDVHPRRQDIGEAEPIGHPQVLEVLDVVGRRLVVVGESGIEGHAGSSAYGLGGDPRQGGHGALGSHAAMVSLMRTRRHGGRSLSGVWLAPPRTKCLRPVRRSPDVG